ncbi:hypothetical protein J5N97_024331 [Dioscorea zingiberensis]|uniref:Pentatricopeptide repeat-containing protein n=1 Tax=Dioscorea zingiberensis TaxID=325984 RepID=A0A9D5H8Q2_9LILI|nr:hypothetical protein J5N97_024331 [Dioscorea zingiberensis]
MSVSSAPCLASPLPPPHRHLKLASPTEYLKLCTTLHEIKHLHCHLIRASLIQSPPFMDSLIAAYSRVSTPMSLRYAKTTFDLFLKADGEASLFCFNSLIRAYSSFSSLDIALELYIRVLDQGLVPDRFTFPPLLAACTRASGFSEGAQLHGFLIKMGEDGGVGGDLFVLNSLIHFYCESGDLESAQQVFDGMPCTKLQDLELGKRIHAYVVESGIELSLGLVNTLIDMYMKCGAVEVAKSLFDSCKDRNIVQLNTMISNYEKLGMARDALGVFSEMITSGLRPDRVSVVAAMSASAQLVELEAGKQFHGYILRHGLDEWDVVSDSVIDMYMKCGELDAANKVFDMMPNKGVVSWNTLCCRAVFGMAIWMLHRGF